MWTEWLTDGADLLVCLEQAGAIEPEVATRFREQPDARPALDEVAERARDLRRWLRGFVERHAGREVGKDAVSGLGPPNALLGRDDGYWQVEAGSDSTDDAAASPRALRPRKVRRWTTPEQLLQPVAEAIVDLVCHADFRLIRACEGRACTLLFLDRTKSHARCWCSMAVCGNRAKAAAHRVRASGRRGRR